MIKATSTFLSLEISVYDQLRCQLGINITLHVLGCNESKCENFQSGMNPNYYSTTVIHHL